MRNSFSPSFKKSMKPFLKGDLIEGTFAQRIKKKEVVEETGEKTEGVSHPPAKLYQRGKELGEIVEII